MAMRAVSGSRTVPAPSRILPENCFREMLDHSACARHGESDFQGSRASESAGFGYMRGLVGIFRPDYRNQA
jgi:hypothetical protein